MIFERERGETLVELLVSTTLLGLIGVAFMGALTSSILISGVDRSYASSEAILRSYANSLEARPYRPCAAGSSTSPYSAADLASDPPAGFTATVTGVQFWDGVSGRPGDTGGRATATFQTTCPAGGDQGIQRMTLQVKGTDGRGTETMTLIRRRA